MICSKPNHHPSIRIYRLFDFYENCNFYLWFHPVWLVSNNLCQITNMYCLIQVWKVMLFYTCSLHDGGQKQKKDLMFFGESNFLHMKKMPVTWASKMNCRMFWMNLQIDLSWWVACVVLIKYLHEHFRIIYVIHKQISLCTLYVYAGLIK